MFLSWHNNSKFYKIFEQDDSKIKLMEDITAADGNQHFWSTWDGYDGVLLNLCWYYECSYFRERQTEFYPVLTVQNYGSSTNLQMPLLSWCLHYYQYQIQIKCHLPSPIRFSLIFLVMISFYSLFFWTRLNHTLSFNLLNGSNILFIFHFLRLYYVIGSQVMWICE